MGTGLQGEQGHRPVRSRLAVTLLAARVPKLNRRVLKPAPANQQAVATLLEFDTATLRAIRDYRKHWDPVVSFLGEHESKRLTTAVWPRAILSLVPALFNAFCG